jgi:hypothetical protein
MPALTGLRSLEAEMTSKTATKKKTRRTKLPARHVARYTINTRDTTEEVRRQTVPFRNPAQFVRDVARVCREYTPIGVKLFSIPQTRVGTPRHRLTVEFGTDARGSYIVQVGITAREVAILLTYLTAHRGKETPSVWFMSDFPRIETNDDDGGEVLQVPSMADSLGDMLAIGGIQ